MKQTQNKLYGKVWGGRGSYVEWKINFEEWYRFACFCVWKGWIDENNKTYEIFENK